MATAPSSPNPCNLKGKTTKQTHPRSLNTRAPLFYPVLSYSEQDSVLSLSGPSDPCGPHPLQRSPEAQQVHTSRPEPTWPESNPLLSSLHAPQALSVGHCVLVLRVCVDNLVVGSVCVCVCAQVCVCARACVCGDITNQVKDKGSVWGHDSSSFAALHQSIIYLFAFLNFLHVYLSHTHTHTHSWSS